MINTRRQAPVSTGTLPRLLEAMNDPDSSAKRVADVVAMDPALAAKVVALANSAQFGLANRVSRVDLAVQLVGATTLQTLAIASAANLFDPGEAMADARNHALEVGCAPRLLAPWAGCSTAEAFAGGLLHDLGELLLWQQKPTEYAEVRAGFVDHEHQRRVEQERYGMDHAAVAAEHLRSWGVPDVLVEPVASHGGPWEGVSRLALVVGAAEAILDEHADQTPRAMLGLPDDDVEDLRADAIADVAEMAALLLQPT